ncbi:MAG: hypothetical protein IPJ28_21855 [Betaproteobacteria bacterium]|nr:hypothetical protein [Betaproteobacteria bacterium]
MGFLRALAAFVTCLAAPLALVVVPGIFSPEFLGELRVEILNGWFAIVFPHPWFHDQDGDRILSSAGALVIAAAQWLTVGTAFAVLARGQPARRLFWLAPLAIVGIGLVVAGLALWLPIEVRPLVS